jgi:putative hydrolase of the HAD superfamily
MTDNIELLLFDLGGVLVDFSGPRDLARFLRTPATPADISKRWVACPHTRAFEAQTITAEEWASRFVKDWDVTLTSERFLTEFGGWSKGFLPGARELLSSLRNRFRLAALSNSNAIHWQRNAELGIPNEFEFVMSSHEVGCCKPDRAIFDAVLLRANTLPNRIMFFDDVEANVIGAQSSGLHARLVGGVTALRECLVQEGLL